MVASHLSARTASSSSFVLAAASVRSASALSCEVLEARSPRAARKSAYDRTPTKSTMIEFTAMIFQRMRFSSPNCSPSSGHRRLPDGLLLYQGAFHMTHDEPTAGAPREVD